MKKKIIVFACLIFIATSCAPPQPEQDSEIQIQLETDLDLPILPACDQNSEPPKIISPNNVIVNSEPPHTFKWDISCIPTKSDLTVQKFRDPPLTVFVDNIHDQFGTHTNNVIQLEPATSYSWTIYDYNGKTSDTGVFTTGPVCSEQELVAPSLIFPLDGSVDDGKGWGNLKEVHTILKYPAMGCTPEYFESDLSLLADFSSNDNWNVGGPGNLGIIEDGWKFFEDDTNELQDCSLYYWRARAAVGANFGDWSETSTFFLDVYGNCYTFPEFKGIQNANCRSDPWAGENFVSVIWQGDSAELIGLNEDATWGMFKLQNDLDVLGEHGYGRTGSSWRVVFSGFLSSFGT